MHNNHGLHGVTGTRLDARRHLFVAKDEHKFSCAHMTMFPDGTKERIHGHNYHVAVVVRWENGRGFVDLACLKAAVAAQCAELHEHLLMPSGSSMVQVVNCDDESTEMLVCGKRYVVPTDELLWLPLDNIVVEGLASYLWDRLEKRLKTSLLEAGVDTMTVTVTEASGQGASYESSPGKT